MIRNRYHAKLLETTLCLIALGWSHGALAFGLLGDCVQEADAVLLVRCLTDGASSSPALETIEVLKGSLDAPRIARYVVDVGHGVARRIMWERDRRMIVVISGGRVDYGKCSPFWDDSNKRRALEAMAYWLDAKNIPDEELKKIDPIDELAAYVRAITSIPRGNAARAIAKLIASDKMVERQAGVAAHHGCGKWYPCDEPVILNALLRRIEDTAPGTSLGWTLEMYEQALDIWGRVKRTDRTPFVQRTLKDRFVRQMLLGLETEAKAIACSALREICRVERGGFEDRFQVDLDRTNALRRELGMRPMKQIPFDREWWRDPDKFARFQRLLRRKGIEAPVTSDGLTEAKVKQLLLSARTLRDFGWEDVSD